MNYTDEFRRLAGNRLNERRLEEADEISLDELPAAKKKQAEELADKFRIKIRTVWSGIHGYIVDFEPVPSASGSAYRIPVDMMKYLANIKGARWFDISGDRFSMGF